MTFKVFFENRPLVITDESESGQIDGLRYESTDAENIDYLINLFDGNTEIPRLTIYCNRADKVFDKFCSHFKSIRAAGTVTRNRKGQILLIYRSGKWDLPKGKIEKNESPEQAAARETEEECGITGVAVIRKITETYHTYKTGKTFVLKKCFWFEALYEGNETPTPQISENILSVAGMSPSEIVDVFDKMYSSTKEVLETITGGD